MEANNTYESDKVIIQRIEHDIIYVRIKDNVEILESDLDDNYQAFKRLMVESPGLFMIRFGRFSMASAESRKKFAAKKREKLKLKEAFIINDLSHRLIAQFHITVFKPQHPIKIFKDEKEAIQWLIKE